MPTAREILLSFFSELDHPVDFKTIQKTTKIKPHFLRRLLTELRYNGKINRDYPRKWIKIGDWHVY